MYPSNPFSRLQSYPVCVLSARTTSSTSSSIHPRSHFLSDILIVIVLMKSVVVILDFMRYPNESLQISNINNSNNDNNNYYYYYQTTKQRMRNRMRFTIEHNLANCWKILQFHSWHQNCTIYIIIVVFSEQNGGPRNFPRKTVKTISNVSPHQLIATEGCGIE